MHHAAFDRAKKVSEKKPQGLIIAAPCAFFSSPRLIINESFAFYFTFS
jgi:hypothetical protein